jgi:hypothetical protein
MWFTVIKSNQNVSKKSRDNSNLYAVASLCAAYIIVELNFGTRSLKRFQRDCESSEKKHPSSVVHGGGVGWISRQSRRNRVVYVKHKKLSLYAKV